MARVILCLLTVVASGAAHNMHSRVGKFYDPYGTLDHTSPTKVNCNAALADERDKTIQQTNCGQPKEVLVYLDQKGVHEQISPEAVWVKKCVGLCDFEGAGICGAGEVEDIQIPVRIYNAKTSKESCAMITVEAHKTCECCVALNGRCPNTLGPTYTEN